MIYITINKNEQIIIDIGYYKSELVLFGIVLFFFSLNFNIFKNYIHCAHFFLFKHCGIILINIMLYLFIKSAKTIGIRSEQLKNTNLESLINHELIKTVNADTGSECSNDNMKYKIYKNILYVHSLFVEMCLVYIFVCISLFLFIVLYYIIIDRNNKQIIIQEYDGNWRYDCPLTKISILIHFGESISSALLVIKSLRIQNLSLTFKINKYIGYFSIILVTIGPSFQVGFK